MEDIVPGFGEYQKSIFEKIMPILDEYTLTSLKIQHLRQKPVDIPIELDLIKRKCVHEISEILLTNNNND